MSTRSFVYGLWCLAVAGGFLAATAYAWSPFAEGRRAGGVYVGGARSYVGPTHK